MMGNGQDAAPSWCVFQNFFNFIGCVIVSQFHKTNSITHSLLKSHSELFSRISIVIGFNRHPFLLFLSSVCFSK